MKTVFNIVLGLCALVLVYICYASIMGPINFEKAKKHRDAAVIAIILLRQQPFLQRICSIISAFPKSLILRVSAVLNCT